MCKDKLHFCNLFLFLVYTFTGLEEIKKVKVIRLELRVVDVLTNRFDTLKQMH